METNSFSQILNFAQSSTCLECGETPVVYASVNNGVFLCEKCGELHKQMPEKISHVKRISDDDWTNHDVDLVLNGGNERIWDAFKFYKMPKDVPMDFKYKTKIGYYYRTMLERLAKGEDLGTPPNLQDGLTLVNEQNEKDVYNTKKSTGKFWDSFNYYKSKGVDYTAKTYKEVKTTVTNPEWQRKVKEEALHTGLKIEQCVIGTATCAKNYIVQTKDQVKEKGFLTVIKEEGKRALTLTRRGLSRMFGYLSKQLADRNEEEKNDSQENIRTPNETKEEKEEKELLVNAEESSPQRLDESDSLLSEDKDFQIKEIKQERKKDEEKNLI